MEPSSNDVGAEGEEGKDYWNRYDTLHEVYMELAEIVEMSKQIEAKAAAESLSDPD